MFCTARLTALDAELLTVCVVEKLALFARSLVVHSVRAPTITLTTTRNTRARMRTAPDSSRLPDCSSSWGVRRRCTEWTCRRQRRTARRKEVGVFIAQVLKVLLVAPARLVAAALRSEERRV